MTHQHFQLTLYKKFLSVQRKWNRNVRNGKEKNKNVIKGKRTMYTSTLTDI